MTSTGTDLYLDLIKKVLTNLIYADPPIQVFGDRAAARLEGRDWPSVAHTMVGLKRLDSLQHCVETVLDEGIPGDFVETGVWRGGASILVRAVLEARAVTDRVVWLADSFQGMPVVDESGHPADYRMRMHVHNDVLAVPLDEVRDNFRRYDLLDDRVRFLAGWFRDTLPTAPLSSLAVVRLDGDLYESTMDALVHLYPKLSAGGFVIVDDYPLKGCREAVDTYRERVGSTEPMEPIDGTAVLWRKA